MLYPGVNCALSGVNWALYLYKSTCTYAGVNWALYPYKFIHAYTHTCNTVYSSNFKSASCKGYPFVCFAAVPRLFHGGNLQALLASLSSTSAFSSVSRSLPRSNHPSPTKSLRVFCCSSQPSLPSQPLPSPVSDRRWGWLARLLPATASIEIGVI